jgi:TRAP-type C4-dicarboxylate transport system permease small subunit
MAMHNTLPHPRGRAGIFLRMLEKFDRFNRSISGWAAWIGFGALVLMVILTCVDVLGSKLFLLPVPGSLDIVQLAQLMAITLAAGITLIERRHVAVEFFVLLLPLSVRRVVAFVAELLCFVLFVLIVWRLFDYGVHLQDGNEVTPTAQIRLAPFAYAAALALVPVCLVLLQQVLSSLLGKSPDEP